jgi:bacterioferritin
MKGDPKVIDALNEILTGELTAINQYFLHARMAKNWGYERIAATVHKESIDEMKHAQNLTDRILFLEGTPNLQKLGKLNIGETIPEQFDADLKLEYTALTNLKAAIKVCFEAADHTSRELLEHILEDEEHHIDWLEQQLGLIKELGKVPYLAEQMHKES